MDVLVALSVGLAYLVSMIETIRGGPVVYFDAAVMFVFLLSATRHIESIARARATERLQLIASAQYQYANRIDSEGRATTIALRELSIGDHIRVASGESVPVDGRLHSADVRIDESLLSGESEPVQRTTGDAVLAGSIALDAPLLLEVTAVGTKLGSANCGRALVPACSSAATAASVVNASRHALPW